MKKIITTAIALAISATASFAHHTGAERLNGNGYLYVTIKNYGWFDVDYSNQQTHRDFIDTENASGGFASVLKQGGTLSLNGSRTIKSYSGFSTQVKCLTNSSVVNGSVEDALSWGAAHHNVTNHIVFEWHGTCFNPSNRVYFDAPKYSD